MTKVCKIFKVASLSNPVGIFQNKHINFLYKPKECCHCRKKGPSIIEAPFKITLKEKKNVQITLWDPPEASCKVDEPSYAQKESRRFSWQTFYISDTLAANLIPKYKGRRKIKVIWWGMTTALHNLCQEIIAECSLWISSLSRWD